MYIYIYMERDCSGTRAGMVCLYLYVALDPGFPSIKSCPRNAGHDKLSLSCGYEL